jgi:hypothetical protein
MSKYTPTTAEVSRRYMLGAWEESGDTSGDDVSQFDRWLASVKADAWDEGDNARRLFVESDDYSTWPMDFRAQPGNPWRGEQA